MKPQELPTLLQVRLTYLRYALECCNWNVSLTCRQLGITHKTFYNIKNKYPDVLTGMPDKVALQINRVFEKDTTPEKIPEDIMFLRELGEL